MRLLLLNRVNVKDEIEEVWWKGGKKGREREEFSEVNTGAVMEK